MTIRTFWNIFLKIWGLKLISNCISVVSLLRYYSSTEVNVAQAIFVSALGFIVYASILLFLVFKSNWIIDTLRLDKGFTEEKIEININGINVLRIGIIVVGGFLISEAIPWVSTEIVTLFEADSLMQRGKLLPHLIQTLMGILLIAYNSEISKFVVEKGS
jgi:hypothetical protein